ncbi:DNA cytosine methyltransferase [Mycoplasma sp. 394]
MIDNKLTYITLFSSAGVGCFGFKKQGYECIATSELLDKRLNIQRINNKCKYQSGYLLGDIKENYDNLYNEIQRWHLLGNNVVDVIIATPPCQGMSVANHKKNNNDINRNSLIVESIKLINNIQPNFFIFENVASFWKTGCLYNKKIVTISEAIKESLGKDYEYQHKIINFKNYGSNSSRTRTLVIGVHKKLTDKIDVEKIFPKYQGEKTLYHVIGDMKSLKWGEYDNEDFFHSFRTYKHHMQSWIQNIKPGQSAFDNLEDINKPHKIINGKIIINKNKNGDKYKRQSFDKVAPCIHTRNDQLASQNTIHPNQNRVFSIRELMKMMTIPNDFKWTNIPLSQLNKLSYDEKVAFSKKNEMNIRHCIGESVPTVIFEQIAKNIKKEFFDEEKFK